MAFVLEQKGSGFSNGFDLVFSNRVSNRIGSYDGLKLSGRGRGYFAFW